MEKGIRTSIASRALVGAILLSAMALNPGAVCGQTEVVPEAEPKKKVEPVFRVSKFAKDNIKRETPKLTTDDAPKNRIASANSLPNFPATGKPETPVETPSVEASPKAVPAKPAKSSVTPKRAPHPLDRALEEANEALREMQSTVYDYTALMAKREQINGVVGAPSYISLKVRCPRTKPDGTKVPFSIYMKFLKPRQVAGREVIWVQGQNDNKLCVHESGGLIGMRRFYLDPQGVLAMRGQKYPIYDAGLENLIVKLIEKAERDREVGPCVVNYKDNANINKSPCSVIELIHDDRREPYEFHKAQVFIDKKLGLPVRFVAYDWPGADGKSKLLEEYTYYKIKTNVGLGDDDFSPENPAYKFPRR